MKPNEREGRGRWLVEGKEEKKRVRMLKSVSSRLNESWKLLRNNFGFCKLVLWVICFLVHFYTVESKAAQQKKKEQGGLLQKVASQGSLCHPAWAEMRRAERSLSTPLFVFPSPPASLPHLSPLSVHIKLLMNDPVRWNTSPGTWAGAQ